MLGKTTKGSAQPQQHERHLSVVFRGKQYAVYSVMQLEDILQITKLELVNMGVPSELIDDKARELMEDRGITTMKSLLEKMTPEEKEEILNRYRYGGIWRNS